MTYAAAVDVLPRRYIIQRVDHAIQIVPEARTERTRVVGADALLVVPHVNLLVERADRTRRPLRLGVADVGGPEEELTIEIRPLDRVHVGDVDLPVPIGTVHVASDAHECEHLEPFAAERSCGAIEPAGRHISAIYLGD